MTNCTTYHLTALATGMGATAATAALVPEMGWLILLVTALGGYVGGLLPEIDHTNSSSFRTVRRLSHLAAIIVPCIQFIYRPADLILAVPLALFMVSRFWDLLHQVMKRGGHTHSILAAVCLSMGVTWVAYLTAGSDAIVPVFMASCTGYLLHLWLDDMYIKKFPDPEIPQEPALTAIGQGRSLELYGILAIGFVSLFGLFGL